MIKLKQNGMLEYFIGFIFIISYIGILISRIYITPFELYSDIGQYYKHYYQDDGVLIFGLEVVTPILFFLAKKLGLNFYDFVFVYSVFYLIPILILSNYIKIKFRIFYFLFFIIWFVPNNTFLLRQYLSFYFLILYFNFHNDHKYTGRALLLLSILTHLSAIMFWVFSLINIKKRSGYLMLSGASVVLYFLQITVFTWQESMMKLLLWLASFDLGGDFNRKIIGQISSMQVDELIGVSSILNSSVICLAATLHSVIIFKHGETSKLMKVFFITAIINLMFASLAVFSNRVGFVSYFFSIPYLMLVLSHFSIKNNLAIKINYSSSYMQRI